jgi:hypothetical protein
MAEHDRKGRPATDHDNSPPSGGESDIIPGRHGKHGGGLESEGEPQDEGREANPPRQADHTQNDR